MDTAQDTGRSIVKEIYINASPARVYRAFTVQSELEQWFVRRAEVELVPGGIFNLRWSEESYVPGMIVELDPPRRFVFDWDDGPEYGVTRISVEFVPEGQGTRLRLVHTGFRETAKSQELYRDVNSGWVSELEHLRAWLDEGRVKAWEATER
jgi:uncharacterized protein YndB with AHSA1/START domain